jgi:hypothetical protein
MPQPKKEYQWGDVNGRPELLVQETYPPPSGEQVERMLAASEGKGVGIGGVHVVLRAATAEEAAAYPDFP